jgi:ASC-1-like (ASCH) protein
MIHQMRLYDRPFELIQKEIKIFEVRLNDEKRQKVQIGEGREILKKMVKDIVIDRLIIIQN